METYIRHIDEALKLARYALDHGETPVACIFVHEPSDKVIAYGMNDTNDSLSGIAHAEFVAIRMVRDMIQDNGGNESSLKELFKDITCYVTVEPCIMCASALKQMGIHKIVFGCGNDRFGGNGTVLSIHNDTSTTVYGMQQYEQTKLVPGIKRREAIMLLRYFYVRENGRAPKPRTKAERKLDKETFPPIEWNKYINRNQFIDNFGEAMAQHFDDNTDLQDDEIDWDIIENRHDKIIAMLQEECLNCSDILLKKKSRHE
ncbi:tRNA-specific adenosine deaminase subunit TAD2 [Nakaseomyces bracarensis]|uniref:tRNA-specific adenosine deaminase subunit TAD2 n=1 Tax=Nakaseomyces bracarensis TaxID=273131 RepID=A0ABR4P139_9SACH